MPKGFLQRGSDFFPDSTDDRKAFANRSELAPDPDVAPSKFMRRFVKHYSMYSILWFSTTRTAVFDAGLFDLFVFSFKNR